MQKLQSSNFSRLFPNTFRPILKVSTGLRYLHHRNLAHMDIKGANIVVSKDGICKLTDFGTLKVSVDAPSICHSRDLKGTPHWMAPEIINGRFDRDSGWFAADIWSLGCTFVEMAIGTAPFPQYEDQYSALFHIAQGAEHSYIPSISSGGNDFIQFCCKIDPNSRPTIDEVLNHQYLRKTSHIKRKNGANHPKESLNTRDDNEAYVQTAEKAPQFLQFNSSRLPSIQLHPFYNVESRTPLSSSIDGIVSPTAIPSNLSGSFAEKEYDMNRSLTVRQEAERELRSQALWNRYRKISSAPTKLPSLNR